jgi:hypothetical protein
MADGFDFVFDGVTRGAVTRVRAPIRLLRAPRGPLGDDCPVIPRAYLDAFAADYPNVDVETVADTNHYTIVLGNSPGPARVAAAIEGAIRDVGGSAHAVRRSRSPGAPGAATCGRSCTDDTALP